MFKKISAIAVLILCLCMPADAQETSANFGTGSVVIGTETTCSSINRGTLRYTNAAGLEFCNESNLWVPAQSSSATCVNDMLGNCNLNSTRSASDPDFIASNIASGVNILGVEGTLQVCQPNAISFGTTTDANMSTYIESKSVTINGLGAPCFLIATFETAGSIILNNVDSGKTIVPIANGDKVKLRMLSKASTLQTATASAYSGNGAFMANWTVTTTSCAGGSGTQVYNTAGTYNFPIPANTQSCKFTITLKGASGGGSSAGAGGGLDFRLNPAGVVAAFDVYLGQGGADTHTGGAGGGGTGVDTGSGGGGASAIKYNSTLLVVAGGGGGGYDDQGGDGGPRNYGGFVTSGEAGGENAEGSGGGSGDGGNNNAGGAGGISVHGTYPGGAGGGSNNNGSAGGGSGGAGGTAVPTFNISGGGGGAGSGENETSGGGGGYGGGGGGTNCGGACGGGGGGGGGYVNTGAIMGGYAAVKGSAVSGSDGVDGYVSIHWGD